MYLDQTTLQYPVTLTLATFRRWDLSVGRQYAFRPQLKAGPLQIGHHAPYLLDQALSAAAQKG